MSDLIATPGSASATVFADTDYADAYLESRLNNSAWTSASSGDKESALIEATRDLCGFPDWMWVGTRVTIAQALPWPRRFARNPDLPNLSTVTDLASLYFSETVIPEGLKKANCELAFEFIRAGSSDVASMDAGQNIISETVGPISVDYSEPWKRAQGLSRFPRVMAYVKPLFVMSQGSSLEMARE